MKSKLAKNIFSAAGQSIVQIIILLILYRYLIYRIGVDQLGIWSVVLATVSSARISELGFGGSIIKFVAAHQAKGDYQAAAESVQTAAISVGALSTIIVLIAYPLLLLALPHLLPVEGLDSGRLILPYGLASLWLTSVACIWMNSIDACLRSELRAGIMIFGSVIFLLFSLIFVEFYGLLGLAVAQVAQSVFLFTAGWVFIRKVMPALPILPQQWKLAYFRDMLGYGINFQVSSFAIFLFEPITKILFGRYGGLIAAGYFEIAERMVTTLRAVVVESNRVIVPVYAGMTSYEVDAPHLYVKNTKNLYFIVIPVFAALMALTPAICEVWVGSFQPHFVIMGAWITLAWFINTVTTPAYFAYLGQGKLYWITISHVVMGVINIIAGSLLGRFFGWQGILAAFVTSLVIGSLIPLWAYHCEHRINLGQLFSTHDRLSSLVCFGLAIISLAGYYIVFDASLLDKWSRVIIITIFIGAMLATATWFHPLRGRLIIMKTSRNR
jgi:O-antigen/teichoic acid export membrane protein